MNLSKQKLVSQMTMIYSINMVYILARIGFTILILRIRAGLA